MDKQNLCSQIKDSMKTVFENRFRGMVLYGSEARGEAHPDSDIDILILLTSPVALGRDLHTIIDALYPLQLEIERPIHAVPVDVDLYEAGEFALYRNAKREGIHI